MPREPHVMSFDFAQDMHDPDGAPLMMVGIEVGGLLAYVPAAGAWQERNVLHTDDGQQQRLKDVHQVRPDPFDHSRWVLPLWWVAAFILGRPAAAPEGCASGAARSQ